MNRFFKKFALAAAICVALRLVVSAGVFTRAEAALRALGKNENFSFALLGLRRGEEPAELSEGGESALPYYEPEPSPPRLQTLETSLPKTRIKPSKKPAEASAPSVEIKNSTSYEIDVNAMLNEPLTYTLSPDEAQILIVHTHGSEAYSQLGGAYEESDRSRTEDKTKNVVQVGNVLADALAERGLTVLHDTELYDFPTYSGSYSRSLASVEKYLAEYPSVKIVIDLHRDAATSEDGSAYRTEYMAPGGIIASQLMIIAATGESGLNFPNWQENMRLALRLQSKMAEKYPGLARPLYVSTERYNQHAAPGYLLIEIGTDGNTLAEAENAAVLLADCMAEVLSALMA